MHNRSMRLTPLEVGPLPSDWQVKPIGDVSEKVRNGFVGKSVEHQVDNGGVLYLQGFNIRPGRVDITRNTYVSNEFHSSQPKSQLKPGDVLVVQSGHIGTCARVPDQFPEANCHALIIVDPQREALDADFLVNYLNSNIGQRRMQGLFVGSSMPHINTSELADYRIPIPPIDEQRKIAEILRTWDKATESCRRLIERRIQIFDFVALQLLTGRHRLTGQQRKWQSVPMTEVLTEITTRNFEKLGRDAVMGVNKILGMIPMKEHVKADDLSRYKVVPSDAFAYNPMRLNIGSIARNMLGRQALVSPDYVAFEVQPNRITPAYFDHLRRTSVWSHFVKDAGSGGVRVRIYFDDLEDLVVELPSIDEQIAITEFLDDARREIFLLEQRRDALSMQKRGLMQKLLTGAWRVKTKEGAT